MELLGMFQGVYVGLLGWAATSLWALGVTHLGEGEKRAIIVCAWVLWMIPAFGTLVHNGLITMVGLMIISGFSTIALSLLLLGKWLRSRVNS